MNKRQREGVFFGDITAEECAILEIGLSRLPNAEHTQREVLAWLSEKVFELAAKGEVLSCYSDECERALHPDGYTWADSSSPVIPLQRQPSQVVTPVEGVA